MKDADDTDISGDSDTTDDEQGESTEGDETPAIENPDGNQDTTDVSENGDQDADQSDEEVTDPAETEIPDETDAPDETEVPDEEEDADKADVNDSSVNALAPTEQTVKAVEPDPTAEDPNNTKDLSSAVITYTNGCVSNGKIRNDADITFKLEANDGKTITKVEYKTKKGEAAESAAKTLTSSDDTYTISKSDLGSEQTVEGVKKWVTDTSVTIIVTTTEVAYTVKADNSSSADYKLYYTKTVDGKTTADTTKGITATSTDKILYSKKGDDVSFVVKANSGATANIRKVSVTAGDGEEKTLTSTSNTDESDGEDPIYTFKPSDLVGLSAEENQDITIMVEATAAATIAIDTTGVSEGAELTAVADADKIYTTAGSFVQAGGSSAAESALEGQLVIFGVKEKANYKAVEDANVTATFAVTDGEAEPCTVTPVDADTEKGVAKHYKIDLSGITESGTLAISVKNELDDEKDAVKKVDFTSVSENAIEIKEKTTNKVLTGKTEKTTANSLNFSAEAKTGYEIYKVEAVYDKNYAEEDGAAITGYVEDLYIGSGYLDPETRQPVEERGNQYNLLVTFGGTDSGDVAADKGHAGKDWTTNSVKIYAYARMKTASVDKNVTFNSEYDYEVTLNDEVTKSEYHDNEYTVKSGAALFEFTVEANVEPTVIAENGESILLGEPEQTDDGWKYQIAASEMSEYQDIYINRKNFDITVNYDNANIKAEVYKTSYAEGEILLYGTSYDEKVIYEGNSAEYDYKFIIEPETGNNTKIDKVSFKMGDSETAETVKANGDGSYVFYVNLTDDVTVDVEIKDEYDLVVSEDGDPITPDKNGVYNVSHASTVTAELIKGNTNVPLFNAEVKDGSAVAATIARISGDVVTLEFDASEYDKVLTVELTLNDKSKTKKSFKVKTTALAKEVSIAGVKNGAVEQPVDTQAEYKLTIKEKNTNLSDLAVKVVPADDAKKADATAIAKAEELVGAWFDDEEKGTLVITAKPAMTGTENAAKIIVVDKSSMTKAQFDAATVDNALTNGVVTVTTKDATIVGKNPTISLVTTTDQVIKVKLDTPKEVVNPVVGKIYYKVELTAPTSFPEGTPASVQTAVSKAATEWNKDPYIEKREIDEAGGLLEIPVMLFTAEEEEKGLDKGVLLSGFSVKASLLQTIAEDGDPSVDATTIKGGEGVTLDGIATKDPYYEVKLGLKKGTTNLITGQDKDVVVATPNFNKLTSYSTVKVEFVNTSTGKVIGTDSYREGFTNEYCGLDAKYDTLSNAVIVNAEYATYFQNAFDNYKNLGIKVTAYAEDSAYGAVATQKLTVVNGIQAINPTAPLEIYKADNKPATFTVATDLNNVSENKKYAPKAKKLEYEIVDAKTQQAADLSPALKANVTVKNGKVTINKNYVVAPKSAQNQFKVKVHAIDYADSDVVEYTNTITITGNPLEMGTIAVFDVTEGRDSAKLVAVNDGALTATQKNGEYCVAVLAPGVKTTKNGYDLTSNSSDIMNSALFAFKSSNAKSVAVDAKGDLTVLKSAKNVKITVTPKDGSNKKGTTLNLKNVGQAADKPLLRITRYLDSTLETETELYEGDTTSLSYKGMGANNYFKLEVVKAVTEDDSTSYVPFYLANYQISYKGAKQIRKIVGEDGDSIVIVANAKETKITLKNKANRTMAAAEYTLTNETFVTDSKAKAPKIATKEKFTQNTSWRSAYYTVKGAKTDNFTDKYVVLSVDQTKKNPSDVNSVFRGDEKCLDKPLPIMLGEGFNLQVDTDYSAGNYNLVATVGSVVNGEFVPEYKDAKVVVKIAKAKAANLTATGSYTLSMKNQSGAYIKYKSGNNLAEYTGTDWESDWDWNEDGDYVNTKNYAKNAIINGQENRFTDYFEARYDYNNNMYITLKSSLPETAPADKPNTPALSDITGNDVAAKNNRIGYISINNGYKYIDVKLTITLKDYTTDKTKYKVTAAPTLAGPKSVSALTIMDGKTKADLYTLIAYSEEMSAGVGLFKPETDRYGNYYLTAQAATTAKSYPVTLYMVPWNAPQAYKDAVRNATGDSAAKQAVYEKYCIKANVTVKVTNKDTTKNKVVVTNKGGNTWNVADTDYLPNTSWSKGIPVSFKSNLGLAENKEISVAASVNNQEADYVTFKLNDPKYLQYVGGNKEYIVLPKSYGMTVTLDKAKLSAAITANAALGAKRNKNLDWGKTLSVKATFSYGEGGPVEDALTFKIKLPKPAETAAVTEALNEAFTQALQSNIETYTMKLKEEEKYYLGDEDTIAYINYEVESYIRGEINKAIKGADVTVTVENKTSDKSVIASIWEVTVKSGDETLYGEKFTIAELLDLNGILASIRNKLNPNGATEASNVILDKDGKVLLKVSSTTTGDEFAKAVRVLLVEELSERGSKNISLSAAREYADKDQTKLTFTLRAKNIMKAPSETGYSTSKWQAITITYRLADKQKESLDRLIKGYLTKYSEEIETVKGIQSAEYKEGATDNVFTVTIKDSEKEEDVEEAFDKWRKDNENRFDEKRHNLAAALETEFGNDWDEVKSITAKVTVTVTKSKTETWTIEKNAGETIEDFADRYYEELLAQEDRIRKKCHEMLKEHNMDKVVFRQLRAVTGEALITVNFEDGSGVSEMFKVEVK